MNNNKNETTESDSKVTGGKKPWVKPELCVLSVEDTHGKSENYAETPNNSMGPS